MNRSELKTLLESEGFLASAYSLEGGSGDDTMCRDERGYGWAVYYTERDEVSEGRIFAHESEACEYFLHWMRSTPTAKPRDGHDNIPRP